MAGIVVNGAAHTVPASSVPSALTLEDRWRTMTGQLVVLPETDAPRGR